MSDLTLVFDESGISQMFGGIDADGKPYDFYVRRVARYTYFTGESASNWPKDYAYILVNGRGDILTGGMTYEGMASAVAGRTLASSGQTQRGER